MLLSVKACMPVDTVIKCESLQIDTIIEVLKPTDRFYVKKGVDKMSHFFSSFFFSLP